MKRFELVLCGVALVLVLSLAAHAAPPEQLRREGDAAMTRAYIAIGVAVLAVAGMVIVMLRKKK